MTEYFPHHDKNDSRQFVKTGEFRSPKAGEYYISGAIPEAYKAPNDLTGDYHIVEDSNLAYYRTKFVGNDNFNKPRQLYVDKVAVMTAENLHEETKTMVWLSSYASNNSRSDYHWMRDACYYEWIRRDYSKGYDDAYKETWE